MIFALAGNQNCGKTTLFNALTGSNQHVGNFPGVTVDQKMGEIRGEKNCSVVDLPGIYSLRPYTQEEIVTRDFILNQKPDGIINIVDATNIERNLYLTLQLLELRVPMVLALNMMDEVRANGGSVDVQKLSAALGIPVVPISAAKGEGVSELIDRAITVARGRILPQVTDFCSDDSAVHRCLHAVIHLISDHAERLGIPTRFCAAKLIEGGDTLEQDLQLDETKRSFWSTASCRWKPKPGWTATPPWPICATPSSRGWWPPRSSSVTKAGSTPVRSNSIRSSPANIPPSPPFWR